MSADPIEPQLNKRLQERTRMGKGMEGEMQKSSSPSSEEITQEPQKQLKAIPDRQVSVHLVGDDIIPDFKYTNDAALRERGYNMASPWTTPYVNVNMRNFQEIDTFLVETGSLLGVHQSYLESGSGARLIDSHGRRLLELGDLADDTNDLYIVPQGWHFHWPSVRTGHYQTTAVSKPDGISGENISMTTLSTSPKVFEIENFMNDEEIEWFLKFGRESVTETSKVGFADGSTPPQENLGERDSRSAFDKSSAFSEKVVKRSFELLGMDYDPLQTDAVQVVHYSNGESFKPHMDWFPDGYPNNNPVYHNGTNRFATIFVYLNDVAKGGETAFFNSSGHDGYDPRNNDMDVDPNTRKIYLSQPDKICEEQSSALKIKPKRGNAILFYSQSPRGDLDFSVLHSGCPVVDQEKWAANIWVWNRPVHGRLAPADSPTIKNPTIFFYNTGHDSVRIIWFDAESGTETTMDDLPSGESMRLYTFMGHAFKFESVETLQDLGRIVVVEQLHENVFFYDGAPRVRHLSGEDYKYDFHNQQNNEVTLNVMLEEGEVSAIGVTSDERAAFFFTTVPPDGRVRFNFPKDHVLVITQIKEMEGDLYEQENLGRVDSKKGGVTIAVLGGEVLVEDIVNPDKAPDEDDYRNIDSTPPNLDNDETILRKDDAIEDTTGNQSSDYVESAEHYTKVDVLNKKSKEVRLLVESVQTSTGTTSKKKKKNLGKLASSFKARIPLRVGQILIVQEREGLSEEGNFQTVERVLVQNEMRLILRDDRFADVLFKTPPPSEPQDEPVAQDEDNVGDVSMTGANVKVDAQGEVVEGDGEQQPEHSQPETRPRKEIDFDPHVGDDLARLEQLEQIYGK